MGSRVEPADPRPRIARALAATAMFPRGALHPTAADQVPGAPGAPPGTLVLIGNAGAAMWHAYQAQKTPGQSLDNWTETVITAAARSLGATALFPFGGPPYLPFQRWAKRADAVHTSPIGILIDAHYGLWHAYRGALAFPRRHALRPAATAAANPCDSCADKPCLTSCPVGALTPGRLDVAACVDHVRSPTGDGCRSAGCRARRACPVGRDHAYAPDQAAFHMAAFLGARPGR